MEKSKSQPSSKSPPQYWTPNHEVQKPTFNTNFAKFYKENYKSYLRKMYSMYIFLKTSIKVWLWNISDKTLLLKFGFMNTAMWSPKPNSEPNFWPKRTTEFNRGQNSGAAHLYCATNPYKTNTPKQTGFTTYRSTMMQHAHQLDLFWVVLCSVLCSFLPCVLLCAQTSFSPLLICIKRWNAKI